MNEIFFSVVVSYSIMLTFACIYFVNYAERKIKRCKEHIRQVTAILREKIDYSELLHAWISGRLLENEFLEKLEDHKRKHVDQFVSNDILKQLLDGI